MVEIKVLDKLEKSSGQAHAVERAVIDDVVGRGVTIVSNTDSSFVAESDDVLYCVADRLSPVKSAVASAKAQGKKVVLLLSSADNSCGARHSVFAYLDKMPLLPSGVFDIKRLAPTLAQVVADAAGLGATEADRLMRSCGMFGAIVGGKLAGFIGSGVTGGMDILHLYDGEKQAQVGRELIKFLTTLIMTGGRVPFALVGSDDGARRQAFAECGLTEGKLIAYVV